MKQINKTTEKVEHQKILNPMDFWDSNLPIHPPDLGKDIQALIDRTFRAKSFLQTNELITHHNLTYTVEDDTSKVLVVEFCKQLIKEYNCQTPSEIAICEIAACAFIRHLEYLQKLKLLMQLIMYSQDYLNKNLSVVGKEADRAQRTFMSAITQLKYLKNSPLTVSIKTETAYLSQYQQVNNKEPEKKGDVINEAK